MLNVDDGKLHPYRVQPYINQPVSISSYFCFPFIINGSPSFTATNVTSQSPRMITYRDQSTTNFSSGNIIVSRSLIIRIIAAVAVIISSRFRT